MDKHGDVHKHCSNDHSECHHSWTNPSVHQTLDELDFDRGIWNSALSGDYNDVKRKLDQNKGSCVNDTDKSGYTALHYACRSGHIDICNLLLAHSANVNATTSSGKATPLHRAAYMGHTEVVSLLLSHGADNLAIDNDGMTPLHKAAERGHLQTVQVLLRNRGRDALMIGDKKGRKPFDLFTTSELKHWWEETKSSYS